MSPLRTVKKFMIGASNAKPGGLFWTLPLRLLFAFVNSEWHRDEGHAVAAPFLLCLESRPRSGSGVEMCKFRRALVDHRRTIAHQAVGIV